MLTDTHRARWYAAGHGGSRQLGQIDESVPKKQHSSGERWGKQQATIDRHRKDHILHFQKELVRCLEDAWERLPLSGDYPPGRTRGAGAVSPRDAGPTFVEGRRRTPQAWTDEQVLIDEEVRGVITKALTAEESRVLAEFDRRLHEATAVAAGPQEVIDALRDGQVRH